MSIYDIEVTDRKGNTIKLEEYKGKILLIVNTATGCGFTPQYEGLENLYKKYKDKGLVVLDFPCNQFGHQAPGSADEIHAFCTSKYDVTFPQFKKIEVNGKNTHPLYKYLKSKKSSFLNKNIKWNFTKYLVDKEGNVIEKYGPTVKPEDIESKIKEVL